MRHKVGAISREFKQGFVHQLQIQVASPNIENENHLGSERRNIREVLFRPHSQVHASRLCSLRQVGYYILKPEFVRQQVVGPEEPVRFREIRNEPPELLVRDSCGKRLRGGANSEARGEYKEQKNCDRTGNREQKALRHFLSSANVITPDLSATRLRGQ